jgi:flagellar basal body rod protein FlgF
LTGTGSDVTTAAITDGTAVATLAASGVTAGAYGESGATRTLAAGGTFIVPQVTVDAKGRTTAAKSVTLTLPAASDLSTYAPKASPALTGTPTAPTADVGTNTTQLATTAFVKTALDNKTDEKGITSVGANGLVLSGTGNNTVSLPAGAADGQVLKYNGTAWAPATDANTTYGAATATALGLVKAAAVGTSNVTLAADGGISIPTATATQKGVVKAAAVDTSNITLASDGGISVPVATASQAGVVKQGTNVTIAADGTLSSTNTTYGAATATALGLVKAAAVGTSNVTLAADGGISIPTATATQKGVVKAAAVGTSNIALAADGGISVPVATASQAGVVKEGDNITISSDGTISANGPQIVTAFNSGPKLAPGVLINSSDHYIPTAGCTASNTIVNIISNIPNPLEGTVTWRSPNSGNFRVTVRRAWDSDDNEVEKQSTIAYICIQ